MSHLFVVIPLVLILTNRCTKDEATGTPALISKEVTDITDTSASSGGLITNDGNAEITERGVCWDLTAQPSIVCPKTSNGRGVGSYTSEITSLKPSTTYHLRAFATNTKGTAYGNELTFTTKASANHPPFFPNPFHINNTTNYQYDNFGKLSGVIENITIISAAIDPDGDKLNYSWNASNGTIEGNGLSAKWQREIISGMIQPGSATITVSDGKGGSDYRIFRFN